MSLLQQVVDSIAEGESLEEALRKHEPAETTAEEIILTVNRLARIDSGLPDLDRERLFTAYCYLVGRMDELTEAIRNTK